MTKAQREYVKLQESVGAVVDQVGYTANGCLRCFVDKGISVFEVVVGRRGKIEYMGCTIKLC